MFHDRAKIFVRGGAGGDGVVSLRREAHVPKGGPDGGDGGRGGEVVLVADPSLRDLSGFRRGAHFKAERGGHGRGAGKHGATPDPLVIRVPPGTVVEDAEGDARWDMLAAGQRTVVARGGGGGRGNRHFATSTRQTPRFAERGLPGQERWLELHLKLLADAGFVGLPNAGKSSLLARLTRAKPKVADYPFTTLEPVLGTLDVGDRQLILADIPGLIEGASEGAGLGHEFLAHVERCRLLVHVLDLQPLDGSDPVENHATVEAELRDHGHGLAGLPRLVCLSKCDLLPDAEVEAAVERWRELTGAEVLATSAATGAGLEDLASAIAHRVPLDEGRDDGAAPGELRATHRVYRPGDEDEIRVERTAPGTYSVHGRRPERLIARHDVENEEAMRYVEERLRSLGVIKALEAAGFEPGDDVEIAGIVFSSIPVRRFDRSPAVRRPLAALLALAAVTLPACGGDDDRDPEVVVREFVEATNEHDAEKLCDELLSPAFIAKTTGAEPGDTDTCKEQLGAVRGLRLRVVEVSRTTIDGDEATVLAVLRVDGARQRREFELTRDDGDWKLAGGSTPGS